MPVKGVSGCAGRAGELSCDSGIRFLLLQIVTGDQASAAQFFLQSFNRSSVQRADLRFFARARMPSTSLPPGVP
jgi:hypothetical protein